MVKAGGACDGPRASGGVCALAWWFWFGGCGSAVWQISTERDRDERGQQHRSFVEREDASRLLWRDGGVQFPGMAGHGVPRTNVFNDVVAVDTGDAFLQACCS